MSASLEEICSQLGYPLIAPLRGIGAGAGLAFRCRNPEGSESVLRFFPFSHTGDVSLDLADNLAKQFNTGTFATGNWATKAQTIHASPESPSGPDLHALMHEIALRWSLSESASGNLISPILEFGHVNRHAYEIRPYYTSTLLDLVEKKVTPNPHLLHSLVDKIWCALEFLHQPEVNQPHGNLTIANVTMNGGGRIESPLWLIDLQDSPETRRAEFKRKDFRDLGLIIYQLACSVEGTVDAVEARVRCRNAAWSHLGKFEEPWKLLCQTLLDLDGHPVGIEFASRRDAMLGPVTPPKGVPAAVPALRPVSAAPPLRNPPSPEEDPAAAPNAETTARLFREQLEAGDSLAALATALASKASDEERAAWCDEIAAATPVASLAESTRFLVLLEEAARIGSMHAAVRLGEFLIEESPAEALSWLDAAFAAGHRETAPLLAHLHEWGGDGLQRDPVKAAHFYRQAVADDDDSDILYRLAALIIREKELESSHPEALRALESAHQGGNFRASDLLAQCLAYGIGTEIDEKRAFQLFTEAWNRSKKTNENYFTASNNLGVCFAIGFGTRRDPDRARHYFKQGELSGHEASKRNLQTLIQT